jgi:hypothetical protein
MTRCTDGQGRLIDHAAEGWLLCPEDRRIVRQCARHAQHAIDEYRDKLGEAWTFDADLRTFAADLRRALFHRVEPTPECCDAPMRLAGNMSMHVLGYECVRCYRRMSVTATFAEGWPAPSQTDLDKLDATP